MYLKSKFAIGINLYSPKQNYKYIVDLAEELGIDDIRFSLTIPNTSANLDDFKKHYENNKNNLIGLFKYAAYKHVRLYQDCNSIPLCFIDKNDLQEMLKWYPNLFEKQTCDKNVLDVAPDLKIYKCFAFTDPEDAPSLIEFKTYEDITHYFNQKFKNIKKAKLINECSDCGTYLLRGHSCGC